METDLSSVPSIVLLQELRKRYDNLTSSVPSKEFAQQEESIFEAIKDGPSSTKPHKVILMGAPGCGKGTQSTFLKEAYGMCHISTGDVLREIAKDQDSELGKEVKATMDKGELVPDNLITQFVLKALEGPRCQSGYVLDGYPRSVTQAEALEEALAKTGSQLNGVFFFDLPHSELIRRIAGRRMHLSSGRTYHVEFKPPKIPGKDDVTGEDLFQRADDTEEILKSRLVAFEASTSPLIEFYRKRGLLRTLDAMAPPEVVREQIRNYMALASIAEELGQSENQIAHAEQRLAAER